MITYNIYGSYQYLVNRYEYLCQKWPWITSVCFNKSNTTGATSGTGIANTSRALEFSGVYCSTCGSIISCVLYLDRCLYFCPSLVIVLSVLLRLTASDYPFDICKIVGFRHILALNQNGKYIGLNNKAHYNLIKWLYKC